MKTVWKFLIINKFIDQILRCCHFQIVSRFNSRSAVCHLQKLMKFFLSLGNDEEVMGSFLKRSDKNVNRVLSGGYASWKELEKESPLGYNEICIRIM